MAKRKSARKKARPAKKSQFRLNFPIIFIIAILIVAVFVGFALKNKNGNTLGTGDRVANPKYIFVVNEPEVATALTGELKPFVKSTDMFYTGKGAKTVDATAAIMNQLSAAFGDRTYFTSIGYSNLNTYVTPLSQIAVVDYITVDYEESTFPTDQVWTFDFPTNLKNMKASFTTIKNTGKKAAIVPTGSGIFKTGTELWDYGDIGYNAGFQMVQTQGFCQQAQRVQDPKDRFEDAAERIVAQHATRGVSLNKLALQVAIGDTSNSVRPERALECVQMAWNEGVNTILIFGNNVDNLRSFLQIARDTTAPTVSSVDTVGIARTSVLSGTVTLTSTAADNNTISSVEFYVDSTKLIGTATVTPFEVPWDTKTVSNGNHTLTAKAFDARNNVQTSTSVTVKVSNAAPTKTPTPKPPTPTPRPTSAVRVTPTPFVSDTVVPAVSISEISSSVTKGSKPRIKVLATDNGKITKGNLYIDGVKVRTYTPTSPASSVTFYYTWDTTSVSNGSHTISADAVDQGNNTGTYSKTVNVIQPL